MARDHSMEWEDERLRSAVETVVEEFESAVRRHERAKYDDSGGGRAKEERAEGWVLSLRDRLVEHLYNGVRGDTVDILLK